MFSSLQPTKKYLLVMFFLSFVLLEVFILIIFKQSRISQDSGERLIHSYDVLRLERQCLIEAQNLASEEQYYILTGDVKFAHAMNETRNKLNDRLMQLGNMKVDNTSYEKSLVTLRDNIQNLESVTQKHVDAIHNKRTTADTLRNAAVETQSALATMRATYEILTRDEPDIIQTRRDEANGKHANYLWTLGIGTILELGILIVGNLIIISLVARNARAKEEIKRTEKLFEIILNALSDGIFDYNIPTGNITYSSSYLKMMGYSSEELGSRENNFYKLIHPDDVNNAVEEMERYLNSNDEVYNNMFRALHKDGRWLWILSRGVAIRDRSGKAVRLIGTHTDITPQKQREEELAYFINENENQRLELGLAKERAEAASQAKSDFLATMSHEIRTPMNAVVGLSRLMMNTKLEAKQKHMMETIVANADILLSLVNDLLDISRIEASQVDLETRAFTFNATFHALQSMFENQITAKGLHLEIDNQIGTESFFGDPTRLQQILMNLVGNALKFTRTGRIAIHGEIISRSGDTANIRVSVADTGVGIPPEKLDMVFDKFVQADQTISRRFGGSGLGLSICKSLIELMGGTISVTSEISKGSVFTITLPLRVNMAPQIKPVVQEKPAETNGSAGTVLIVEDYAANVLVATMMLENLGYAADVANCGSEAIQKIKDCQKPYLAILMDVQMGDMSGYETTRRIRDIEQQRGFQHKIIGLTAHALAGDEEKCLAAGMDDYMTKPINLSLLADKLAHAAQAA